MRAVRRTMRQGMAGLAVLAALAPAVAGQRPIDWNTKPVLLLTIGQGTEVFEKFGHNALIVWDDAAGQPLVYNWGMFDFQQPNFIGRFLTGDTKYWMAPMTLEQSNAQYQALNRTMVVQELALTPAQKARLVAMLADNATEANKWYRYDYYRDNCSTRVRDALDAVTGGVLRAAMTAQPGQGSYRWHTRRELAYSAPLYFGSQLVLGVDADAPLNGWEEAFLPQSLSESVSRIELPAADGLPARPLAGPIDTLFRAAREPEPRTVSPKLGLAAFVGVVLGLVLLGLTMLGRVGAALAMAGWGVACAVIGTVLLLAWFATRHVFMANNPSVALVSPAWLLGTVAAVMALRGGVSTAVRSALRWLLVIAVVGTAGAVLLGHGGSALELAALLLPGHAAVAHAADRHRRRSAVVVPRDP
ncbi:MAG: DUF4105 domain-containing protein [Gemmatimonadaceae bacterium]|nr:DUF4105 domain-containing protein [Gemmatimonadaceae bacterium]